MEKQRVCKICNKRYSNGKALGGHMRSHLAKLPLPLPPPKPQQVVLSTTSHELSSSSSDNNHVEILETEESDTESELSQFMAPRKLRSKSKRHRKSPPEALLFADDDKEEDDDTPSAEDAAMYLIKLSKDKSWGKRKIEDQEESSSLVRVRSRSSSTSRRFKCKTCNKVFGSYQALGGHKANHKKAKYNEEDDDEIDEEEWSEESNIKAVLDDKRRRFECPFCLKVFSSGQALGGHKKVHYSSNLHIISTRKSCRNNFVIDLNLPALEVE